jgi:hypothetical protein
MLSQSFVKFTHLALAAVVASALGPTSPLVLTSAPAQGASDDVAVVDGWEAPRTLLDGVSDPEDLAVSRTGDQAVAGIHTGDLMLAERLAGGAWEAPQTVVDSGRVVSAQIAYDDQGRLVATWSENSSHPVVFSRYQRANGSWSDLTVVAERSAGTFWELQLLTNTRGDAAVGWVWSGTADHPASRVLVARRTPNRTWLAPATWSGPVMFDLALGDAGFSALMLGRISESAEVISVARRPLGGAWGNELELARLTDTAQSIAMGTVSVDGTGTTTAVWRDQVAGAWQVRAARAAQGQTWSHPRALGTHVGFTSESAPRVLATPSGRVLAVWMRGDGALQAVRRTPGAAGEWGTPHRIKGPGLVMFDASLDPTGRAAVIWTRGGWFGEPGRGIVARLMSSTGSWGAPADVAAATSRVFFPQVEPAHQDALTAWSNLYDVDHLRIRVSSHD